MLHMTDKQQVTKQVLEFSQWDKQLDPKFGEQVKRCQEKHLQREEPGCAVGRDN